MATHCPCAPSASSSSATVVPARTRTVISAGSCSTTPAGAWTARADVATATADIELRPPTDGHDRSGLDAADLGRRSRSSVTPTGLRGCGASSPQRDPAGSTLPGIGGAIGIEHLVHPRLRIEVVGREHPAHEVALLDADAVLARQHPAGFDRGEHDLLARGVHLLEHAGLARVERQQRMEVAVARVEHVQHPQTTRRGDLVDSTEHLDESRARHHGVVQVVVGGDARDGAERRLAALPQQLPLGLVGRDPDGTARRAHG